MVINYTYDANGTKLNYRTINNTESYDYIGSFYHENGTLSHILTSEGRVVRDADGYFSHHEYYIKDHLGNTRVVFTEDDGVIKNNDYYPFGMLMGGTDAQPVDGDNKFLYNGKEYINNTYLNLSWYDYGARFYDPQLGRFHGIDPLQQFHSPYLYAGNDPINNIDPSGMWTIDNRIGWYDGYTVDKNGYIKWVDDTGGDEYDVLYTEEDYEAAKKTGIVNKYGNPEPKRQEKFYDTTILPSLENTDENFQEVDYFDPGSKTWEKNPKTGKYEYVYNWNLHQGHYAFTNNEWVASRLFMFLSSNTDVEWSMRGNKNNKWFIGTLHAGSQAPNPHFSFFKEFTNEITTKNMDGFDLMSIRVDVHSHPGNSITKDLTG